MGKQPGMVHGPRGERHGPGELAMANGEQQLLLAQVEIREALQPREHLHPVGWTGPSRVTPPTAQPQQRQGATQTDLGQISTDLACKGMGGIDHHLERHPISKGSIQDSPNRIGGSDSPNRWLKTRVGPIGPQGRPTDQAELHVPAHGQQG